MLAVKMQLSRKEYNKIIKIKKIFAKTECPFCLNREKDKNLILWENKYWEIRYNKFPYGNIKHHLLAFPKRHVEYTKDLTKEEYASFLEVEKFISNYFKGKPYFSFIRGTFKGRSIAHLHYHYLPGNLHEKHIVLALKDEGFI